MEQLILDHMLKEEFSFPDPSFPIQFYIDDLHQWPDGQVPLHWHFGYEIFSAFNASRHRSTSFCPIPCFL